MLEASFHLRRAGQYGHTPASRPSLPLQQLKPFSAVRSPVQLGRVIAASSKFGVFSAGNSICLRLGLSAMATVAAAPPKLATACVGHGEKLPEEYVKKIPKTDAEILNFFLCFLADQGLPDVAVFVNGGYVRDLLLGKEPDDLDLSLCLRDCAAEITVATLLHLMESYVEKHPEFGITTFKNATILSNESKDKQLDTFKAHFTNTEGIKTEVDVMPTIGEEKYEGDSRIPIRDQRGSPEEDALRRDLTIGALLMRVKRGSGPSTSSASLQYELLDFYGGVDDIRKGILRSPYPHGRNPAELQELVLRAREEKELAAALGIDSMPADEASQVLWWGKVLMDDPLRICRALRFAAKFHFDLHPSFWQAVPFALEPLRTKVAGSRKDTEYQKIGGYGFQASVEFYELAFTRTFGPGEGKLRLAAGLLGGVDHKSKPKTLSEVRSFDLQMFRDFASKLQSLTKADASELVGGLMAAAIAATKFEGNDTPTSEFTRACDGMCVSNATREAGLSPLSASLKMAAHPPPSTSFDCAVADACGVSAEELARHVQVWEGMQDCNARSGPERLTTCRRSLALAMLQRRVPEGLAREVEASFQALSFVRPAVRGAVLSAKGVLEVPNPLKRQVMLLFEVSLRLLRYDAPVEDAESLLKLFEAMPKLRSAFSDSVWMEQDGKTLKSEFQPPKRGGGKDAKRSKASG
eukprot:TRINITY_DN61501_c0_g1_i1.p1 TRINITY_DN61501_c0_g1~~TRINITY_DN61501_c0_g1_i1.p1  ORF type:complete len:694 (-),score=139.06 TRINITY_DN61501_c0_g1_i1:304-2385(-)